MQEYRLGAGGATVCAWRSGAGGRRRPDGRGLARAAAAAARQPARRPGHCLGCAPARPSATARPAAVAPAAWPGAASGASARIPRMRRRARPASGRPCSRGDAPARPEPPVRPLRRCDPARSGRLPGAGSPPLADGSALADRARPAAAVDGSSGQGAVRTTVPGRRLRRCAGAGSRRRRGAGRPTAPARWGAGRRSSAGGFPEADDPAAGETAESPPVAVPIRQTVGTALRRPADAEAACPCRSSRCGQEADAARAVPRGDGDAPAPRSAAGADHAAGPEGRDDRRAPADSAGDDAAGLRPCRAGLPSAPR